MDFGAFWRVGFYDVRDLDEGILKQIKLEEFLPLVRNILVLVTTNSFPPVLPVSDY